jgi:hypothetical protein
MLSALGGQVLRSQGIAEAPEPLGTYETTAYPKVL